MSCRCSARVTITPSACFSLFYEHLVTGSPHYNPSQAMLDGITLYDRRTQLPIPKAALLGIFPHYVPYCNNICETCEEHSRTLCTDFELLELQAKWHRTI